MSELKLELVQSWMKQMGVERLERKDNQPFYNVLVEDGSNRSRIIIFVFVYLKGSGKTEF